MKAIPAILASVLLVAPATAAPRYQATSHLIGLDGKPHGTVTFEAATRDVLILFDLTGLPPGPHGIHIHTSGNCDPKKGFFTAGPILSPVAGHHHGYYAKTGPLAGDLPNQFAGPDGRINASVITNAFTLGDGTKSLFDRDGASIIVTAQADDYLTEPAGGSGARIACGVIVRAPVSPRRPAPRHP